MKWTEWLIALSLVIIGLSCLTTSATFMLNPDSIRDYLQTLLQICFWIGIPAIIALALYFILRRKKRDS
jgi:hypothetical protein